MGNMGLHMAGNLQKNGFDVKGFDLSESTLKKAEEMGIKPITSLTEVSSDVDFIVASLPKTQDVEYVLKEEGGVFASASPGTCIVDTSTISPLAAKEFSNEAVKK